MNNIIIVAPSYNESIGGAIVLHKLCHILNNIGFSSQLTTVPHLNGNGSEFFTNKDYNTPIAQSISEDDIVIYPEIIRNNPFGSKNVVRYILGPNHTPELGNHMETWGENDFWLYFHDLFYDGYRDKNILHVIESKVVKFINKNERRTMGECFTYRKRKGDSNLNIIHNKYAFEIPFGYPDESLIDLFNKCERFYSYDTETYLSVLAALCGCESIIVPYPGTEKEDIINKQPSFKYGIAYGLDDLKYAKATQQQLRQHLFNLEGLQVGETKLMFSKIINYFNK